MDHPMLAARTTSHPYRCRSPITAVLGLVVVGIASVSSISDDFVPARGPRRPLSKGNRPSIARHSAEDFLEEVGAPGGLAQFEGSPLSLWTSLLLVVVCIPGIVSTIQRTGQAKYIEKTYDLPGSANGGLEMRSIAGGIVAYFTNLNYKMENSPEEGKIRFVGALQGSLSTAFYVTMVLFGACFGFGLALNSLFPLGPFDLGWYMWFAPCLISPWAGWYYWNRAFRRDVVEMQLQMSDDKSITTLSALGDKETIENLQSGVRFQNTKGKLFRLMESGMEYQEGLFEVLGMVNQPSVIQQEKQTAKQTA